MDNFNINASNALLDALNDRHSNINTEGIEEFLNNNANPNAKSPNGRSALTQAIRILGVNSYNEDAINMVKVLVKGGAILSADDKKELLELLGEERGNEIIQLSYGNKEKILAASDMVFQMPGNPYLNAENMEDLKEYMGTAGRKRRGRGKSKKSSNKTKRRGKSRRKKSRRKLSF